MSRDSYANENYRPLSSDILFSLVHSQFFLPRKLKHMLRHHTWSLLPLVVSQALGTSQTRPNPSSRLEIPKLKTSSCTLSILYDGSTVCTYVYICTIYMCHRFWKLIESMRTYAWDVSTNDYFEYQCPRSREILFWTKPIFIFVLIIYF